VSKRKCQLDAGAFDRLRDEHARNEDLAEKLRAAEVKIVGLESEVEDLKRDNADLRRQLEAARVTEPLAGNDPGPMPEFLRREAIAS
jgi:hypothetical protein